MRNRWFLISEYLIKKNGLHLLEATKWAWQDIYFA